MWSLASTQTMRTLTERSSVARARAVRVKSKAMEKTSWTTCQGRLCVATESASGHNLQVGCGQQVAAELELCAPPQQARPN